MPHHRFTAASPIDPELIPGARNAIRDCLRLQPNERITIITDEATREIAAALQPEVEEVGSELRRLRSRGIRRSVRSPTCRASFSTISPLRRSRFSARKRRRGELGSRMQMSAVVNKHHIRHGHMVNISRQIMLRRNAGRFPAIDALSQRAQSSALAAPNASAAARRGNGFRSRSFAQL